MPQNFQVLRCYKCLVFQVHQMKKSNKFECKLCGEKQSMKRHYGLGTGKECRLHVQKLNGIRGDMEDLDKSMSTEDENFDENIITHKEQLSNVKTESKWSDYIEAPEACLQENNKEDMYLGDAEVVLEKPLKRRKVIRNSKRWNKKSSYKNKDFEELSPEESATEDPITKYSTIDVPDNGIKFGLEKNPTIKKTASKKFVPPICTKQSKWAQFTEESNENLPDNDNQNADTRREIILTESKSLKTKPIEKEKATSLINLPEKIFSKWDCHEDTKEPTTIIPRFNVPVTVSKSNNQTQRLFSLCNDSDLDKILDI